MPDSHTKEQRRYNMSQIRSTGSQAEQKLGQILRELLPGVNLIEHFKELPGRPDYWVPDLRLAVFADGCFFHQCPQHFVMPEKNRDYWEPKIARNRERDRQVNTMLRNKGIKPVRVWEHELRQDAASARRRLQRAVRERRREIALLGIQGDQI